MIGDTPIGVIVAWILLAATLALFGIIIATPSMSIG